MDKEKIFKNLFTGFGGQFVAIILGLAVPRIFITNYGSDLNGLINTVTQIFTYMSILEAGIGQAAKNLLFKPFREKDIEKVSEISSIAKAYYTRFTMIYAIAVIGIAFLLPFVLKTNVSGFTVTAIVLLEGMTGVISFYFIETQMIILVVDGKSYVNNAITLVNRIIGYAVKIIMASLGLNIILLELVFFLVAIVRVLLFNLYFHKNYYWIDYNRKCADKKLKDRNSYVLTELSHVIFSSTDMIVLSVFVSTTASSVYGVYNMIFANISILINSVLSSLNYLLGQSFCENLKKYEILHDAFNSIFIGAMTVFMSVGYVLAIPFIKLYTRGVSDVNYIYLTLPFMFCVIQILSSFRAVSDELTGLAGYAKRNSFVSLIEAILNVSLSVILVKETGIIGVTLGTVLALPLKVIWCTYVADIKIMHRTCWKSVSIMGINFLLFITVVIISRFFQPVVNSIMDFVVWGTVLTLVFGTIGSILNFAVNKDCWRVLKKYLIKRA